MKSKNVSVGFCVASLATIGVAVALAAAPTSSGITINTPIQVQGPTQMGLYTITATGTMSLAQTDSLESFTFTFYTPTGGEKSPTFKPPFTPPKSGDSSNYSCVANTVQKGAWQFVATMSWMDFTTKQNGSMTKKANFNVGG